MGSGCITVCVTGLFGLVIVAAYITYIVYGIIFLVNDYSISHDCSGSSLWAYVLTSVIIAFTRLRAVSAVSNSRGDGEFIDVFMSLVCYMVIEFGFAIWGGFELFKYACEPLIHTNLWLIGKITFIFQIVIGSSILVIPVILVILTYFDNNKKTNTLTSSQPIIDNNTNQMDRRLYTSDDVSRTV